VSRRLPADRLQPALIDRLIDDGAGAEAADEEARFITRSRLRQAVLRDLVWLFNATRLDGLVDMSHVPHARQSVLNFGLPAFSGAWASALRPEDLERAMRDAIVEFEPRILRDTLTVRALVESDQLDHHNVIGVEIQGHLWAQPAPLDLRVRTEIDLETGRVEIADLQSGTGH
jgi:type VI secretion system protein ImpF